MKRLLILCLFFSSASLYAQESSKTVAFNFENGELIDALKTYAKLTNQKMVIDPSVRGKVNILAPQPVTTEEAFNLLASALAQNGFSYSLQGDTMHIASARNLQRNFREVVTELPPMKPERMVTWIVTLKHANADDVNRSMRILPSKDGELSPNTATNQLIISDFLSNLYAVKKILGEIDRPRTHASKAVAKTKTEN